MPDQTPPDVERPGEAAFVAACQRELAGLRQLAEEEAEAARQQLRRLGRELVELDRRLLSTTRQGAFFAELAQRQPEWLAEEYRRLESLPEVRRVWVEGPIVYVQTGPLSLEHAGQRHALGEFRLELDLRGEIRIVNVANRGARPLWDHPHVQMGLPCLGNLREGVLKLLAEFELAAATRVLLDFLQTYHPPTAYGPIELWPLEE